MSVIGSPIVAGGSTNKLNAASVAAAYNPNSLYDVGDLVTYKGGFYKCKTAIETAEAWNAAHWDAVTLEDLLDEKVAKESGKGLSTNDFTNADKQKLAGIEDMSAAEANAGSATTGRLVSAAVIAGAINNKKGVANGIAELDGNGKVPAAQLPSFMDDVLDGYLYNCKFYAEQEHTTELTAEGGKIYIDKETNKQYRWSGSAYAEISSSLALGETASTAYAGNKGKEAHDLAEAALPKTGGTMSGNIAMGDNKVTGLADPTANQDAANKKYVDDEIAKLTVDSELSDTSEKPVQNKVVSREINSLKSTANWFNSIPGTTQTVNFDSNGKPASVVHTSGNDIIRTDSFVWSTDSVTETRTLADGRYIILTTNLTTLVTTISDIQEGA